MILMSGGSYRGPKEIKYLFIDGGCLRQFAEDATARYPSFSICNIHWAQLVSGYNKVFYYDSLPPRKKDEEEGAYLKRIEKNETFFDDLRAISGVHVYEGDARRRRKVVQQKKVDIMIAVDMLTHSFRRNMHQATLLTADLDFKPLVDALVQDGMQVELWYPHGKPNKELIYAADKRIPLTFQNLHGWSYEAYRKLYPLPRMEHKQEKNIQGGFLRDTWPTAVGTTADVYEMSDATFTAVFQSASQDYFNFVSHSDVGLLKLYVHECFREFWKSPI